MGRRRIVVDPVLEQLEANRRSEIWREEPKITSKPKTTETTGRTVSFQNPVDIMSRWQEESRQYQMGRFPTTDDRTDFVNTVIEWESQPVSDEEITFATAMADVEKKGNASSRLPGLEGTIGENTDAQNYLSSLLSLQEAQKQQQAKRESAGILSRLRISPETMSDEEKEAYVFSPWSVYSQRILQQLDDDNLSPWEKADVLVGGGYTPTQAQVLLGHMSSSVEQMNVLSALMDRQKFEDMQATAAEVAEEHPVWSSLASIPLKVFGDMGSSLEDMTQLGVKNRINPYSENKIMPTAASTIRQTVGNTIDNDLLRDVYDLGMVGGDLALDWAIGEMMFPTVGMAYADDIARVGANYVDDAMDIGRRYANDVATMAGEYSDDVGHAFAAGYDGSISPQEYQIGFDFYYGEGQAGLDFDTAMQWADDAGLEIGKDAGFRAHSLGVNESNAAKSLTGSGVGDILKEVTYSPINPGPLEEQFAKSFNGATYTNKVLSEDTVMYRVYGGKAQRAGSYLSRTPQRGGLQSQLDLALNPAWGNSTEEVAQVVLPKGTVIYEGVAAPQDLLDSMGNVVGTLPGGGNQIYIPEIDVRWFG